MMRSSRGSDGGYYKVLFIITVLMVAILSVLYVLKRHHALTLSKSLEEVQREAEDTETALNQKITEMQERLEKSFELVKKLQSDLKQCKESLWMLGNDTKASSKQLEQCEENLKSIQLAKDDVESEMKIVSSKNSQLVEEMEKLEIEVTSEKEISKTCQNQLSVCQPNLNECSATAESVKSQLQKCLGRCPSAASNQMTNDFLKTPQAPNVLPMNPDPSIPHEQQLRSLELNVPPGEVEHSNTYE